MPLEAQSGEEGIVGDPWGDTGRRTLKGDSFVGLALKEGGALNFRR